MVVILKAQINTNLRKTQKVAFLNTMKLIVAEAQHFRKLKLYFQFNPFYSPYLRGIKQTKIFKLLSCCSVSISAF